MDVRRRFVVTAAGVAPLVLRSAVPPLALLAWPATAVRAQGAWPQRPVRFVIPNAPGSSIDTIGRLLMAGMATALPMTTVADNKAGAAGALGVEAGRTSPADGYTLIVGSSSAISTAPMLQKAAKYDPLRDFDLISLVALLPNVLVCHPGLPVRSAQELIAYARGKGDKSNMASAGSGSASHLAGAAFQAAAGFKSLHVPYKGGSQGVASVVSGETDWVLTPAPAAMSLVAGGRLRLLGHSMPANTQPLGDTPSLAGTVPGFEFSGWIGLLAPKGLPEAVTAALGEAVAKALRTPEMLKAFETHGAVPTASSPAEFRQFLARDIAQNKRAVEAAGVQAE
ncbi:MAG: tripartite tricarboxylate transporter substrate binding protein [Rubrivivax sp.]|nr:tripartite tricarboxylate transporter substrate binding protein [Rubrivivax sp.]